MGLQINCVWPALKKWPRRGATLGGALPLWERDNWPMFYRYPIQTNARRIYKVNFVALAE